MINLNDNIHIGLEKIATKQILTKQLLSIAEQGGKNAPSARASLMKGDPRTQKIMDIANHRLAETNRGIGHVRGAREWLKTRGFTGKEQGAWPAERVRR